MIVDNTQKKIRNISNPLCFSGYRDFGNCFMQFDGPIKQEFNYTKFNKKHMKICFFAGANSVHSHRWVRYFVTKKNEVHWISLMPSIEPLQNVQFYNIGPLSTNPLKILIQTIKFKKLIKKINPDILHIHSVGTYGLIGILSNFHPVIVTAWGSDVLLGRKSIIKRPLVRYVLKKADSITCDADHMIEVMADLGITKEKMKLVYFGVEPDKFKPASKNKELLKKWNVNNSPSVISLRNLEPIYDIETLIKSVPLILKNFPEVKIIIAGAGSQENYLKELSQSLGVQNSIRFIGRYSHDELPIYLNSIDVYVSTSLSDAGIAASTAEAMACGLPVVITNSGENDKWVCDSYNGYIVPVRNPKILSEKIVYLLKNPDLRKKLGENNRKTIEDKNNYYKEMEKMEHFYRSLIK